jgi:hypothetical protein
MPANASQRPPLPFWRGHVLKASCRHEGECKPLFQIEARHVTFDKPDAMAQLRPLAQLGGGTIQHGPGKVHSHNLMARVRQRDQHAPGARPELKDWPAKASCVFQVELNVAGKQSPPVKRS